MLDIIIFLNKFRTIIITNFVIKQKNYFISKYVAQLWRIFLMNTTEFHPNIKIYIINISYSTQLKFHYNFTSLIKILNCNKITRKEKKIY